MYLEDQIVDLNNIGEILDSFIKKRVTHILCDDLPVDDYCNTDNFAEVVEKLIIIHIRMWMLEDKVSETADDKTISELKKKIDICFKVKRPRLVEAMNKIIDDAIKNNKQIREDSVKLYKNYE